MSLKFEFTLKFGTFFNFFSSSHGASFHFSSPGNNSFYANFIVRSVISASKLYIKKCFHLNDPNMVRYKIQRQVNNMLVLFELRRTEAFHLTKRTIKK
jgi:hypothetical protein